MQLLGPYNTSLQAFHYEELLNMYKQAIAGGGFAGNTTFNAIAISNLIQQSQNFSTLPVPTEGLVVTDDSLNYPLSLLSARYNAIVSETNDFTDTAEQLIGVLEKDTGLLDMLLSGADLQKWLAEQPVLEPSIKFSWDYGMGNGPSSDEIDKIYPLNSVVYPSDCPTNTYLDVTDGSVYTGLVAPATTISIPSQDMIWTWAPMTTGERSEPLYGDGWAELNLLESNPIINFLPNPLVTTILPIGGTVSGVFSIGGQVSGGTVPIYVKIQFVPRRNNAVITPQNVISDPGFESGGSTWTFGGGWALSSDGNAHSGSYYAKKTPLTAWSSLTSYISGNLVSYLGYEYVCINANLDSLPNTPGNTDWARSGVLRSQTFPLAALNQVYVEGWIKNLAADGLLTISLVCLDTNGVELSPPISIPSVGSAQDYLEVSAVLQALPPTDSNGNPVSVAAGRIEISVYGQTAGAWCFDDLRVHLPQNISPYTVDQDDIAVYISQPNGLPLEIFFQNQDFVIDDISNVTMENVPDGVAYTVRFTEYYPGYQCSVNETVWSPVVMLDPARPYPDTETVFNPIPIVGSAFPITDETGVATGLTMEVVSRPLYEYYFQISTPATPQYGATAVLEIDLATPTYMNGLVISPFSNYPMRLVQVDTESFASDTKQTVGLPNALIERPMVLTFPTTLLRRVYLTLYQENYDLNTLEVQPPDYVRRNALNQLQAVLPFNVRRQQRVAPDYYTGAQYVFGVENVEGIADTPVLPGIFIAGPHHFTGCPDVFRFDADVYDPGSIPSFQVYLCWIAYDSSGAVLNEELDGVEIYPAECAVWPFPLPSILDRSKIDHVDIFPKFVFSSSEVVLQRYLLQVSNV